MINSNIFNSERILIFEGITGSGKSTQIKMLGNYLSKSYNVGYFNTKKIYPLINTLRPTKVETKDQIIQESIFFQFMNWMMFKDTQQHYDIALVDRFLLSNYIYTLEKIQKFNIPLNSVEIKSMVLNPLGMNPLKDTITLYLDCPTRIAQERILHRKRNKFDFEEQKNARRIYLQEIKAYSYSLNIINGAEDLRTVHTNILSSLESVL